MNTKNTKKIPTIAIKILPNKPNKDGLCEIKVRVTIDRGVRYYGIGEMVAPDKFDNNAGKMIGKSKDAHVLNMKITSELNKANEVIEEMRKRNEAYTFEIFEKYYMQKSLGEFDYYFEMAVGDVSLPRANLYVRVLKETKELFGDDVSVSDLTLDNINRYEEYMVAKPHNT